jgi:hypothetical protein
LSEGKNWILDMQSMVSDAIIGAGGRLYVEQRKVAVSYKRRKYIYKH